jgi:hypothetical protein
LVCLDCNDDVPVHCAYCRTAGWQLQLNAAAESRLLVFTGLQQQCTTQHINLMVITKTCHSLYALQAVRLASCHVVITVVLLSIKHTHAVHHLHIAN